MKPRLAISGLLVLALVLSCQSVYAGGWKWIAYGDTRTNDAAHRSVLTSIVANTPDYAFIINVGDVVEDGSQSSLWNIWTSACNDILGGTGQSSVPPKYMSAVGNHEQISSTYGLNNWRNYLSGQAQQFGNDGKFFYFDYEDARFIVLNSEESYTGAQQAMLLDAIQNNTKKWLFAIWHKPIFDFGVKMYEPSIHQNWGVPLYNHGCDIMFMGHAHYYVRSKKLNLNGQINPPLDPARGTVQIVTGDGGAPHAAVDEIHDGNGYMVAYSYDQNTPAYYGYTELNVDGDTLRMRHISASGEVMDQAVYTANPKPNVTPRYHLWTTVTGSGTVEQNPADSMHYVGTKVVLHANPALGSRFVGWTGALTGSNNPDSLIMDSDKTVGANFESLPEGKFELRVTVAGDGGIELDPPGSYYDAGTVVRATARPAPGCVLGTWGGAATGDSASITIVVDTNKILTATFRPLQINSLSLQTIGQGIVSVSPGGGVYPETTSVTISATPASGWEFVEWTGSVNGNINPCQLQMKYSSEAKARFRKSGDHVWSLTPTHDSFVRGSIYASTNYGGDSSLFVVEGNSDANRRRAYLQFDLAAVGGFLTNATLLLRTRPNGLPDGVPARVVACQGQSDSWTEGTLNWRNVPPEGAALDTTVGMTGTGMSYAWDVTNFVSTELAGDKIVTLLLRDRPGVSRTVAFESGESGFPPVLEVQTSDDASAEGESNVPERFGLEQNYPNPFNPTTVVSSQLPVASHVTLAVYDLLGRQVAVLVNERRAAGTYHDTFSAAGRSTSGGDAAGLASGVYYYRLHAVPLTGPAFMATRTMVLVR